MRTVVLLLVIAVVAMLSVTVLQYEQLRTMRSLAEMLYEQAHVTPGKLEEPMAHWHVDWQCVNSEGQTVTWNVNITQGSGADVDPNETFDQSYARFKEQVRLDKLAHHPVG